MQLTVKDVTKILNVSEKTIYRWVKSGQIPTYRVGDQFRFNRLEILEWATARRIDVAQDIVLTDEARELNLPSLVEALKNGGVFYRLGGRDRSGALQEVVENLRLPEGTDRDTLLRIFLAREELATTATGDGIAIPHVRTPVILHIETPQLALCFLENPVDFGALDGNPVYALFTLICPTIKSHLHLLSRLAFALRDPGFKEAVKNRSLREEILSQAARVEGKLAPKGNP
jgi:PTS system nitrogen regulatory IIA component